ncbi:flavin reductase like domain-containing protein [Lasiosphaeris hirsuta]|uniref:Flavin reductase like domain-containing protein n=1 Tax=Lasiosphaeris hirsuta TaxID=260670 RepID=A0AA40AQ22_9PEZI|nr:flavin reductase like domain-containing protein [Lasiosphaeris hirsuta]
MSSRRVLGLTAEHALLLHNGRAPPMMQPAAVAARDTCHGHVSDGTGRNTAIHNPTRRHLQTSSSHPSGGTSPHSPAAAGSEASADSDAPAPSLSHKVRTLMRLLTHPVVACTSTQPGTASHPAKPRAMTMSSFASLALHPTPAVSFNIATPSRTLHAIEASRRFNIHILSDDAAGARVADILSRGSAVAKQLLEGRDEEYGCEVVAGDRAGDGAAPVLSGPGILHVLRCQLLDEPAKGLVKVHDHVIVLGEVLEILEGVKGAQHGGRTEKAARFGLLYGDRRFRSLGECIRGYKRV